MHAAARLLQPPRSWHVVAVDEYAVTRKLPAVRRRDRVLTPRVRFGAAVSLASLTAALLLGVGRVEVTATDPAASVVPAVASLASLASVASTEPVLASGTFARPDTLGLSDSSAQSDEEIVILDEAPEEEIIIIVAGEPAPTRISSRAATRARARVLARSQVQEAMTSRRLGDTAAAQRALEAALAALPSYAPAAAALAEIHLERHNYGAALRYAQRAARSAPRKLEYMLLLGDAYERTHHREAARKLWRKAAGYGSAEATARLGD